MSVDSPRLNVGHCTDRGRQRELNEDSYLILTTPAIAPEMVSLLAVADGMGGHQAGDVASRMLVETLEGLFTSSAYRQFVAYSPQHPDYYVVVLKEVLEQINEKIYDRSVGRRDLNGMGTTATVVLLAGWRLFLGHVGDSRGYLMRDGDLRQLTCDHTWVAEQVQDGQMTPEEAERHRQRNVLTQSLGSDLLVRVERGMQPARPNDMLLLCSDGLYSVVSDAEIRKVLRENADPQTACEELVAFANRRGGPDNITVVAAGLTTGGPKSNVTGGRVLGPMEQEVAAQPLADTLKLKRSRNGWRKRVRRLARWLGMALALLLGALLSGLGAWLVALIPFPTAGHMSAVVAAGAFVLGALVGWLLRPPRPE